ncbi:hypothetical protein LEP1GSC059_3278 [Leptospira noguchii serovar Panama str. CZ214]|uniref:Uncharacterized protein n=1 Tax=Leptospira noguchii serovar Panama str. CZ214 TaxID=1001595 RepID=T0FGT7_9LEPT|nr:hypothetical protein LEP1GSC059_3278 [Leptospira noguchii serovar Panama str. CZ214]
MREPRSPFQSAAQHFKFFVYSKTIIERNMLRRRISTSIAFAVVIQGSIRFFQ